VGNNTAAKRRIGKKFPIYPLDMMMRWADNGIMDIDKLIDRASKAKIKQTLITYKKEKKAREKLLKALAEENKRYFKRLQADPSALLKSDRDNERYNEWRSAILERDRKTCILCGSTKGQHAHHIERWIDNIGCRYNLKNGVSLCVKCHKQYHGKYGRCFPDRITAKLVRYIKSIY
jgi:5-methylcytosine-specific restriction endonuclease McrA